LNKRNTLKLTPIQKSFEKELFQVRQTPFTPLKTSIVSFPPNTPHQTVMNVPPERILEKTKRIIAVQRYTAHTRKLHA
jgi:hypothetical protein